MDKGTVAIVLGSNSDMDIVDDSGMLKMLDEIGVAWELSIISAHRNPDELSGYCRGMVEFGTQIFVGVAGMAAALPGAVAAAIGAMPLPEATCVVVGVPLPSKEFPDGMDALLAMVQMPPGVPVAVPGIGKSGLKKAAILAAQMAGLQNPEVGRRLVEYSRKNRKPAQIGVLKSKNWAGPNQKKEGETEG